jgi:hypothetical protein
MSANGIVVGTAVSTALTGLFKASWAFIGKENLISTNPRARRDITPIPMKSQVFLIKIVYLNEAKRI